MAARKAKARRPAAKAKASKSIPAAAAAIDGGAVRLQSVRGRTQFFFRALAGGGDGTCTTEMETGKTTWCEGSCGGDDCHLYSYYDPKDPGKTPPEDMSRWKDEGKHTGKDKGFKHKLNVWYKCSCAPA